MIVHSGTSSYRRWTWTLASSVRGRLPGLYQAISTTVDDASAAVDQLSTCLVDVEAWLKASRLRLNPAKTQVMWLSSQQLLARLDMAAVRAYLVLMSSSVRVQEMARDLGMVNGD